MKDSTTLNFLKVWLLNYKQNQSNLGMNSKRYHLKQKPKKNSNTSHKYLKENLE